MTIEEKQMQRLIGFTMDFHADVYKDVIQVVKLDVFNATSYESMMLSITMLLGNVSKNIIDNNVTHETSKFIKSATVALLFLIINIANQEQIMSALCESRMQQILKEIKSAVKKHGMQYNVSYEKQLLIIAEELGEIASDLLEKKYKESIIETYQTIAMFIKLAWLINERLETNN